jgi:hypothetical protein
MNWPIALLTLLLIHFALSVFLHKQVLGRIKARHFGLWVSLGSPTPLEAMSTAAIPGLFRPTGTLSYLGWLHLRSFRDLGDGDIAAWAGRLRFLNVTTVVLGLTLIAATIAHESS